MKDSAALISKMRAALSFVFLFRFLPLAFCLSSGGVEIDDVSGVGGAGVYAVTLDLGVERRHLHAEHARGAALVAARAQQRPAYEFGLEAPHLFGEVDGRAAVEGAAALERLDLLKQRERQLPYRLNLDGRGLPRGVPGHVRVERIVLLFQ